MQLLAPFSALFTISSVSHGGTISICTSGVTMLSIRSDRRLNEAHISAVPTSSRRLGNNHPETLESKSDRAVLYKEQDRYNDAEQLLFEAIEGRRVASKTTANESCRRVTRHSQYSPILMGRRRQLANQEATNSLKISIP
jgi:hypothetical protein